MRSPVLKLNTKPIRGIPPVPNRQFPFLAYISQLKAEQVAQRIIAWKRATVHYELSQ
jgi:hypothetical protein